MSRRERQRRRRRKRGSPVARFFALGSVLLVSTVAIVALAVAGWVINVAQSAPNLKQLHPHIPGAPSQIFAADGTSLGYLVSDNLRQPIAGNLIPQRLKEATIAIEDRRFYQHGALDYQGIVRAAVKDAFSGGSGLQGGSDLTMQLVDNTYLPPSVRAQHNLQYKIEQAKLATQLENQHSKNWILDSYLNDVPYGTLGGQTSYGVAAASEMFFNKPVQRLSLAQEALLAGLPQAPSSYNPFIDRAAARRRRSEVLNSMVTAGYITRAQADATARKPLEVHPGSPYQTTSPQPYAFDFVKQQAERALCPTHPNNCPVLYNGGLKIYSTIDLRKEAIAQQAIDNHASLLAGEGGPGVAAALASVDPNNGHVVAIANSSNYQQTRFDYATQGNRQTGSAFKVFALMTLIHDYDGSPDATYYTSKALPVGWTSLAPAWSVHTDTNTYAGSINITHATIISDNTVYAQLVVDLGMDKFNAMAHAMGITSKLDPDPAEVLGGLTIGVTPLQMADAYSTIANGGTHIPATVINKIVFPDGSVRNLGDPHHTTVFPYNQTYTATSVLKQVITNPSGTGTAANYGCPAAGKTGTAENLANAWFVGYTPRMTTAVWVGNPTGNVPMINGFGGVLAAPIWHDYMQQASGGYCGNWTPPATPFQGVAFQGPHASGGSAGTTYSTSGGYQYQGGGTTTPTPAPSTGGGAAAGNSGGGTAGGGGNTGGGNGTNGYNNPTLFAQPPQPGPATGNSGNTGAG